MPSTRTRWWPALALITLAPGCSGETSAPPSAPGPAAPFPSAAVPQKIESPVVVETHKDHGQGAKLVEPTPAAEADKDGSSDLKIVAPKVDPAPPKGDQAPKAAAAVKLTDDEVAEVKKLPAAEQAAALKQMVCPVSDEHLGAMAMPVKVTALGKTFYLCCESCKKELDRDPKAVVAKLSGK